jgi:rod shape determining protein RodA
VLVELAGVTKKGATRWLDLGPINIQPSEIMKIGLPLLLAWYFHKREAVLQWKDYVIATLLLVFPTILILKQPDLGTAILVFSSGFAVIFFAGLSWKILTGLILTGLASLPLVWTLMHDYQRQRVLTLLDPGSDPLGKGFHIIQSTVAIGSGGILGKGWMQGTQTHLEFIPERTTDFIFSVYAEEFGLIGNFVLLLIYFALIIRGLERWYLVRPPAGQCRHPDFFHVCLCQYGHGQRHLAGRGCAPALHELWRNGHDHARHRLWHSNDHPAQPSPDPRVTLPGSA